MGKNPPNPIRPNKPADPTTRPPARSHIYGRIRFRIFIFSGFWAGYGYYVFSRVVTRPTRPNKYTYYYTKLLDPLSPSFSFLLCYSLTGASPSLSPSFTLSLLPLFHRQASCTGSRQLLHRHGQAVSSLSRRLLGEELAVTGWLKSGGTSPDLVRSRQI